MLREFPLALDLGTPGTHVARVLAASPKVGRIVRAAPLLEPVSADWWSLVADEEALPFAGPRFSLIVSALSLQGANDLPGALVQIRRALAPDGFFLACLIGGQTLSELRAAFSAAEAEITGGASPRVAPFADVRDLGGLLQRAGFALPVTDVDTVTVRYADPLSLMRDVRAMGATSTLVDRQRHPLKRGVLMRAMELYTERAADPDGRIRATFETVWLSGWAPHESQPKPLKPGSAKVRLADALGAVARKPETGGA